MTDITNAPLVSRYAKLVLMQEDVFAKNRHFSETFEAERALSNPPGKPFNFRDKNQFPKSYPLYIAMLKSADDLLEFILQNFPRATPENIDEARYFVSDISEKRIQIDTLSVESLQTVSDLVIPVFVGRRLLSVEKLPLDAQRMEFFTAYAEAYKDLILDSKDRPLDQIVEMYPEWAVQNWTRFSHAQLQIAKQKLGKIDS